MILRYYQQDAINACYKHLAEKNNNPCIVIPTGGGKTPVIASIARDVVLRWRGRILILAHVKELLQQAADKIGMIEPKLKERTGVYSAGLNSRDTASEVLIAGIQSVYKRACELGAFDLILIDEAHLIPPDGEGMYRKFLHDMTIINPNVRLIGLTATPYRTSSGAVCSPDNLLNEICYEVGVKELIAGGYLSKLVSKAARGEVETSHLHIRGGEYIQQEAEALMNDKEVVKKACWEIINATQERNSVLIFCAGVNHANAVMELLRDHDLEVEGVFGDTLAGFREQYLHDFQQGKLKYLVNVGVLTTGFDAPNVDCVVLLRPTHSAGLYYQMCGRGFRIAKGKENCLVLDFGGNVQRHGPLDMIEVAEELQRKKSTGSGEAPTRKCQECLTVVLACYSRCPECGYTFPVMAPHDAFASSDGLISGEVSYEEVEVRNVYYSVHIKRGASENTPKTMRIDYEINFQRTESEWVCPEHTGYAYEKFTKWWAIMAPTCELPCTASEAVRLANAGAVQQVTRIKIKKVSGEKFTRIVGYHTEEPKVVENLPFVLDDDEDDEIPF